MAFDPDKYLAETAPAETKQEKSSTTSSSFDPDAYLASGPKQYSQLESGLTGAADAASFGFGDELVGAVNGSALGGIKKLLGLKTDEDVKSYLQARDKQRLVNEEAQKQNPGSYMAGNVAGGLAGALIPVGAAAQGASLAARVGMGALSGAGVGALTGIGSSNEESLFGTLGDAATQGAVGGALGGAIPLAGAAISKGASLGKELLSHTGIGQNLARGLEGGQALQEAAQAGAELIPEQKLNINKLATPEVVSQAITQGGDDVAKSLSLGIKESADKIAAIKASGQKVDLSPIRSQLQQQVAQAQASGSEVDMRAAFNALKEFNSLSGITRAEGEIGGIIGQAGDDVLAHAEGSAQDQISKIISGRDEALANHKGAFATQLKDAQERANLFKTTSRRTQRGVEEVIKDANSNRYDVAIDKLNSLRDSLKPEEYSQISDQLLDKMVQTESSTKSELYKRQLTSLKKRLTSMSSKQEQIGELVFNPEIPNNIKDRLIPAIEGSSTPKDLNYNIGQHLGDEISSIGDASIPKLDRSVGGKVLERLESEKASLKTQIADELNQAKDKLSMTKDMFGKQIQEASEQGRATTQDLSGKIQQIRDNLSNNPTEALNTLDSMRDSIPQDTYNRIRNQISAYSQISSNRTAGNAVDVAKKFGTQGISEQIPGLSEALKSDAAVQEFVSAIGIDPTKLQGKDISSTIDRLIKSKISKGGLDLEKAVIAAKNSGSEIAANIADSVKAKVDSLGSKLKGVPSYESSLDGEKNIFEQGIKAVSKLTGLKHEVINDVSNALGVKVGKSFSKPTIQSMSDFINADATALKSIGERLTASQNPAWKQFGEVISGMSDKGPDKRRVLMFTLQSNPEYRKILNDLNNKESK